MAQFLEIFCHIRSGILRAIERDAAVEDFYNEFSCFLSTLLYTQADFDDAVGIVSVRVFDNVCAGFVNGELDFSDIPLSKAELSGGVGDEGPHVSQELGFALDLQGLDGMFILTCQGCSQRWSGIPLGCLRRIFRFVQEFIDSLLFILEYFI